MPATECSHRWGVDSMSELSVFVCVCLSDFSHRDLSLVAVLVDLQPQWAPLCKMVRER